MQEKFTQRELEILKYLVKGMSNKEIAEIIHVSSHTVKAHISDILKKMNAKNRILAAVYGAQIIENNNDSQPPF